ncbi:MAG: winged helix-turn-helix transcriptional regulator, partial [Candidatus Heimdallarchaeota archaeon]|nr:winged helix-turn-helix transcriptional regulator [Candidatus Heimdallarchaeota archaeon]
YDQTVNLTFEENPESIDFDYLDVQILKYLYQYSGITQKELATKLDLSESQISRRIKTMEQNGIIRGYQTGFRPFNNLITIVCLIKVNKEVNHLIYCLSQIPYPKTIAYENRNQIAIGLELPAKELKGFLNGLYLLRPFMKSYFLQFYHRSPKVTYQDSFDLFDKETNSWEQIAKEFQCSMNKMETI